MPVPNTYSKYRQFYTARSFMDGMLISTRMGTSSVGPTALAAGAVIGAKIKADSIGLTQIADAMLRHVESVTWSATPATAHVVNVFRAPPSGATVLGAYFGPGSAQGHAVDEQDTWVVTLKSARTGLRLSAQQCSLSGQTVAATGYKALALNAGRCTLLASEGLLMSLGISGSPASLQQPSCIIEWRPKANA